MNCMRFTRRQYTGCDVSQAEGLICEYSMILDDGMEKVDGWQRRTDGEILHVVECIDQRADYGDIHPGCFQLVEGVRIVWDRVRSSIGQRDKLNLPMLAMMSRRILVE
jgi:hypothetical protein